MSDTFQKKAALCVVAFIACTAQASETVSYTYDSLGRLKTVQTAGGLSSGIQRSYSYDPSGNRTMLQVSGTAGSGVVTISARGSIANVSSVGVVLGVNIAGSPAPTGTVTFTQKGLFLGSASVSSGQASVILEGFAVGTHTITASYSGDGSNAPYSFTFTIKVQNLLWLPAVLQILLSN
jgi:YD repeat-containing protein